MSEPEQDTAQEIPSPAEPHAAAMATETSGREDDEALEDEDAALFTSVDESLQKLEDRLDGALSDLGKRNQQLEDYLEFLAQERRRELQGTEADQLTIDDALAAAEPPDDTSTAPPSDAE